MTFDAFCKGRKDPPPPDPGKYDIPSTIGKGPKFTLHQRHKQFDVEYAPKYNQLPSTLSKKGSTIGPLTSRTRKTDDVPGPSLYTTTIGTGRKSSMHVKHFEEKNENPGPGSYNIPSSFDGPAYSCRTGKRNTYIVDNVPVPPGTYDIPSDISKRRPMTISSREREHFKKKAHPGPIYNVQKPTGSESRKTAFPKGPREPPIPITPGPADYQQITSVGGKSIGTKMRSRTPMNKQERNRMPYYDIGTTINTKSVTIGSRPATSYETMSPGPGYDIGTLMVPKNKTIGERHVVHDPMDDNPAPGSYWIGEQPKKPPPIIGFPGPDDRCVINIKKEKQKPGPGYYDAQPTDMFISTSRRGRSIAHKKDEDYMPDTAAPYHSCTSTLGGPMYTIGLRDV